MVANPQHKLLEQFGVNFLDDKCVRRRFVEVIDDHLTSRVIAGEFNRHVQLLHLLNHLRHDEATGEKVVARRPVGEDIFVSFDLDRVQEVCVRIAVAGELVDSPLFEWKRVSSIDARLPWVDVDRALRLGQHDVRSLRVAPEIELCTPGDVSYCTIIAAHDIKIRDLGRNVGKELVEQRDVGERADGEDCDVVWILRNKFL